MITQQNTSSNVIRQMFYADPKMLKSTQIKKLSAIAHRVAEMETVDDDAMLALAALNAMGVRIYN